MKKQDCCLVELCQANLGEETELLFSEIMSG